MGVSLPVVFAFAGPASAQSTLNNGGPVSLVTTGTVTPGPYSSGQTINMQVVANSTLDLANLENFGFSGEPAIKVEMCSDPGGTVANLPVTPTNNCDGGTIDSTTAINSDGSLTLNGFTVYALPDNVTLGEPANQLPVCGLAPNYCVLYVGPNQTDFADPHLFSAPFQTAANADDLGENPGDGTPEAPLAIGLPLLGLGVVGGTTYLRRRRRTPAA